MNTKTSEGVLCHCEIDPAGHVPGWAGCPETITARSYKRSDDVGGIGEYGAVVGARGTCSACGRGKVKVRGARIGGRLPGFAPHVRDKTYPVHLAYAPALAAHRRPGRGSDWCTGAGQVPAETSFVLSPEVTKWAACYGSENVDLDGAAIDLGQSLGGAA